MFRTVLHRGCVALLATGLYVSPTLAADGSRPKDITIDVEFNFITQAVNHWQATGAFEDEGTIKHDHSENFYGSTAAVTDSPEGTNGTFTWTFHRSITPDPAFPGLYKSSGGWRMLGGTGDYEGISGEGLITGTLNFITGQLHDHFVGKVDCPKC